MSELSATIQNAILSIGSSTRIGKGVLRDRTFYQVIITDNLNSCYKLRSFEVQHISYLAGAVAKMGERMASHEVRGLIPSAPLTRHSFRQREGHRGSLSFLALN